MIGATSQATNPQTYSDNEVYATNGTLQANKLNATVNINVTVVILWAPGSKHIIFCFCVCKGHYRISSVHIGWLNDSKLEFTLMSTQCYHL